MEYQQKKRTSRSDLVASPAIYRALQTYYLEININNCHKVNMKIDSGCHDSIVNMVVWQALGEPPLGPIPVRRLSATGAQVDVKGQFIATIQYGGRTFQLPLQVSGRPDTRNLIGRRWFPSLHLDWNSIFHCVGTNCLTRFQPRSDKQRRLAMEMVGRTNHFYLVLKLAGVEVKMMLDTGATQTKINMEHWKALGKPPLKPSRILILDTANKAMALEGECSIEVEYQGQKGVLPLLVMSAERGCAVLGTNWFQHLRLDFNTIFENITFAKPIVIQL